MYKILAFQLTCVFTVHGHPQTISFISFPIAVILTYIPCCAPLVETPRSILVMVMSHAYLTKYYSGFNTDYTFFLG